MNRSSLLRLTATVAVLGTTALGYGPTALAATPAAHTAPDTVIPPATTSSPRADTLVNAGPSGFLHAPEGDRNRVWSSDSGKDTLLSALFTNATVAHGADVLVANPTGQRFLLQDMNSGADTWFTLPAGEISQGAFGSRLVSLAPASGSTPAALHIFSSAGGQQTMTTATGWPSGSRIGWVVGGDASDALMTYMQGSQEGLALIDLSSGQVTSVFSDLPTSQFGTVLTDQYVGWHSYGATPVLHFVPRADPGATESTVSIPKPQISGATGIALGGIAVAGGNLLLGYAYQSGTPSTTQDTLYQMPLTGGTPTPLMAQISRGQMDALSSGAVVLGGSSASDWGVHRFTAAADGSVASALVYSDAQAPYAVRGLSADNGSIEVITGVDAQDERLSSRTVQWGGTAPTYGSPSFALPPVSTDCSAAPTCAPPIANPWGVAQLARNGSAPYDAIQVTGAGYSVYPGTSGGTLVDANGNWVVYNGSNGTQYIGTNTVPGLSEDVLWTRPAGAAALTDGSYEWAAGTTPGSVGLIDLARKATQQTVQTGAPCVPSELQTAADRWIYWSCGVSGPAGVYDLTTHQDVTVPSGYAELGDGYVVTHDETRGELVLTDLHTDTPVTSDLAPLPAGAVADDRNTTWTVDRSSGGGVAYVDAQSGIHLVNPQVPASPTQPTVSTTLQAGQQLAPGGVITGYDTALVMQPDGNLVLFLQISGNQRGPAIWSSNTSGHPGAHAVMQPDGNLVVYSTSGAALWSSHTNGHPGAYITLQHDSNLVLYAANGSALWSTGTNVRGQQIPVGTVMKPGWWTQAQTTYLAVQADGNLVLYRTVDNKVLWSSQTYGHPGAYAVMQPDGNLVVHRPGGAALWSTRTNNHPGAHAIVQNDGNFVVYRSGGGPTSGGALWASGTSAK
ncbi:hypothetical protein [Streptacidiphilus neutrinimicus]|uniref:hypothetical protein n=1 Tax=Streptacidiphilus neutrinimicus TaxID=105420 RepID=UPI0005A62892|nr:hypothetical protein [Streptacidiphilus neutrinimicus]